MADPLKLGKYEIRRRIGAGAMGIVFEAWDPGIGRRVAVKTLKQDILDSSEAADVLARFRREAQAAGRLNHPNIVAVYELGETDGITFIAMEYVDGKELKEFCDKGECFPLAQAVRIITELLVALDVAHAAGVVHRDIKPGNIFLVGNDVVKVGDFGVARVESSELTQAGSVLGTPSYMSPEQICGQVVDGRADLFSAGVILYQLLTGEKPFQGNSLATIMHKLLKEEPTPPSVINVHVPPAFDAVITKALAKRPENRYQNGAEFAAAVRAASDQKSVAAMSTPMIIDDATIALSGSADAATSSHRDPTPMPAALRSDPRPAATAPIRPLPTTKRKTSTTGLSVLVATLLLAAAALWWWLMGMPIPFVHRTAETLPAPAAKAVVEPAPTEATATAIALSIRPANGKERFRPGERIVLDIKPSRNAHLYCFMQDETTQITRFFPNRFTGDSLVPTAGVRVPAGNEFSINANAKGVEELIVCYASEAEILGQVTGTIGNGDIDKPATIANVANLDKVFFTAGGATLGVARFPILSRQ